MREVKKSKRLLQIAQLIRPGASVADVGTDHAYLPIYLVKNGISKEVIAADIVDGPLKMAEINIGKYGFENSIKIIKSDGLKNLPRDEVQDIVIAGMGGELIFDILKKGAWTDRDKSFILQPMTMEAYLRKMLWGEGYEIEGEYPVEEGRHIYTIMKVRYTGLIRDEDDYRCAVGMIEKKMGDGERYLIREKKRAEDKKTRATHIGDEQMLAYWSTAMKKIEKLLEDR